MISINPAGAGLNWPNLKRVGTSARIIILHCGGPKDHERITDKTDLSDSTDTTDSTCLTRKEFERFHPDNT